MNTAKSVKGFVDNRNGKMIPCIQNIQRGDRGTVILAHGFASDKENSTAELLREKLREKDISVLSLDLPGHGETTDGGDKLTVEECLADISFIEEFAKYMNPFGEIYYFGSSFGAYLMLLFVSGKKHWGHKVFLRSAAVDMPTLFDEELGKNKAKLEKEGFITMKFNYREPLKITKAFYDSLQNNSVYDKFTGEGIKTFFVQGTEDEEVPFASVKAFCDKFNLPLSVFEGGDHRLSKEGMPEKVVELASKFFAE